MILLTSLELLLGWERLALFGRNGYIEIIKWLTIKYFYFAGYLPVYWYASSMIISITGGESRSICYLYSR
jgi:hypothetical protein